VITYNNVMKLNHFNISLIKSNIRILSCIAGISGSLLILCIGFAIAEVLGIMEEYYAE